LFRWLKSLFSRGPKHVSDPPELIEYRELTEEETATLEEGLVKLLQAGIKLGPVYEGISLRGVAAEMAGNENFIEYVNRFGLSQSSIGWDILTQEFAEAEYEGFLNAAKFEDHCYDGINEYGFANLVGQVLRLANGLWNVEHIVVSNSRKPKAPLPFGHPVSISIESTPLVSPFELIHEKDFDWQLIDRLNERLPASAIERFAFLHDGGQAIVVFLSPNDVQKLSVLLGWTFQTSANSAFQRISED
jgi:hypothetical protein